MNKDRFNRPTLRTIAAMTGLSKPTVSRALNDIPGISDATRRRVKAVADQIGYSPSLAGMQLKKGRTNSLAISVDGQHELHHSTAQFIRGVSQAVRLRHFRCIAATIDHSPDGQHFLEELIAGKLVDGIILNAVRPDDERIQILLEADLPFATHGRVRQGFPFPHYDFDNESFARAAVHHLARHGPGPILGIAPPEEQSYGMAIREGANDAASAAGIEMIWPDSLSSDHCVNDIKQTVLDVLREITPITGIISASTTAGLAAVSAIRANGQQLGDDIGVVSKDCSLFLKSLEPGIITCQENFERAGTFLSHALIDQIEKGGCPPMHEIEPFAGFV